MVLWPPWRTLLKYQVFKKTNILKRTFFENSCSTLISSDSQIKYQKRFFRVVLNSPEHPWAAGKRQAASHGFIWSNGLFPADLRFSYCYFQIDAFVFRVKTITWGPLTHWHNLTSDLVSGWIKPLYLQPECCFEFNSYEITGCIFSTVLRVLSRLYYKWTQK